MTQETMLGRKAVFASLGLHSLCIAAIVLFSTSVTRHPETIRVLLTLDPPVVAGGGGGTSNETGKKGLQAQAPERRHEVSKAHQKNRAVLPDRVIEKKPVTNKAAVERRAQPAMTEDVLPVANEQSEATSNPGPAAAAGQSDLQSQPNGGGGAGEGSGGGSGGGSGSGTGSGVGSFTGPGRGESSAVLKNRYLKEHFAYIRDLINKNIVYPPMAKKLGWQGRVVVCFVVRENGKVEELRIEKSSGYEVLDRNVIETIQRVQPFPRPPVSAEITIPLSYALK